MPSPSCAQNKLHIYKYGVYIYNIIIILLLCMIDKFRAINCKYKQKSEMLGNGYYTKRILT